LAQSLNGWQRVQWSEWEWQKLSPEWCRQYFVIILLPVTTNINNIDDHVVYVWMLWKWHSVSESEVLI